MTSERRVGAASVPVRWDDGRRGVVRVRVEPAHEALSTADVVRMMVFCEETRAWSGGELLPSAEGGDLTEALCRALFGAARELARRGWGGLDSRPDRPVIWLLGLNVRQLLSPDRAEAQRARGELGRLLREVTAAP